MGEKPKEPEVLAGKEAAGKVGGGKGKGVAPQVVAGKGKGVAVSGLDTPDGDFEVCCILKVGLRMNCINPVTYYCRIPGSWHHPVSRQPVWLPVLHSTTGRLH